MFRQNISQHRWYWHQAIINIRFVITLLLLMKLLMKMLGLIMLLIPRKWVKIIIMTVSGIHRRNRRTFALHALRPALADTIKETSGFK